MGHTNFGTFEFANSIPPFFATTQHSMNPLTLQIHLSYGLVALIAAAKGGHVPFRSMFRHRGNGI
jgi:hypothetical protein